MHLQKGMVVETKVQTDSPDDSNFLLCCYLRLYNNSLLNAVCLVDTVFYLVALSFNLTWTTIEIFSAASYVNINRNLLHIAYGAIMLGNVINLIYAIHFKTKYRKYNVLLKNGYFSCYYHLRIFWGVTSTLLSAIIFAYLMSLAAPTSGGDKALIEFNNFKRTSNLFSVVYLLYSIFCFFSSFGFKAAWYGMQAKDVDFYFS
jgi:hypothetical protein